MISKTKIKIAYLGIPGSYSFTAAQKYFGRKTDLAGFKTIKEVFDKINKSRVDSIVVPLENTTTGSIAETYDLLIDSRLSITGEIILKISHQLLVHKNQHNVKNITLCYSHPQAFLQCEGILNKHQNIKPVFTSDTASGAEIVARRNNVTEAAISGSSAAKIYGLKILSKNIEDNKNNYTRFAVISTGKNKAGNKISVAFSVAHVPGSLFRVLKSYAENNLNLMKIESRPVFGKLWEYIFFVDFEVNPDQERELKETLSQMKENCIFLNILGRYEKGKTYET